MHKQKEVCERGLRGEQPAVTAVAMGITPTSVFTHRSRAYSWLYERAREADVHRSVFLTWHRHKQAKPSEPPRVSREGIPAGSPSSCEGVPRCVMSACRP